MISLQSWKSKREQHVKKSLFSVIFHFHEFFWLLFRNFEVVACYCLFLFFRFFTLVSGKFWWKNSSFVVISWFFQIKFFNWNFKIVIFSQTVGNKTIVFFVIFVAESSLFSVFVHTWLWVDLHRLIRNSDDAD